MSLFDLLFLALFAAAAVALLAAAGLAVRGQFGRARRLLVRLLACAAVYMATVAAVSLVLPRRVLPAGARQCFDDWCIAVAGVRSTAEGPSVKYDVTLRLSSRARRVAQRERNLAVYLTDDRDLRCDPAPAGPAAGFDVLLQPGESVVVERSFAVPAAAAGVKLVTAHEGGFPIGWFIIGYDTWFRKPAVVQLR